MRRIWSWCILCMLFACQLLKAQEVSVRRIGMEQGLPSVRLFDVLAVPQGMVWIASSAGLAAYNGQYFNVFTTSDGLPDNEIRKIIYQPRTRSVWFLTARGRTGWVDENGNVTIPDHPKIQRLEMTDLIPGPGDQVWLADANGEILNVRKHQIINSFHTGRGRIHGMVLDSAKSLWICFQQHSQIGLYKAGQFRILDELDAESKGGLSGKPALLPNGDLVFPGEQGLRFIHPLSVSELPEFSSQNLDGGSAYTVLPASHGQCWVGTSTGLWLLGWKNGEFQVLRQVLKNYKILSLARDFEGNIWAATANSGLLFIPDQFVELQDYGGKPAENCILSMHVDAKGNIWAGTLDGSVFYGKPGETPLRLSGTSNANVNQITGNEWVWIATERGIYSNKPRQQVLLPGKNVQAITFSPDGTMYAAADRSLYVWEPNSVNPKHYYIGHASTLYWHPIENQLLIATSIGIQQWKNGKKSQRVSSALFRGQEISQMAYDPVRHVLWVATMGSGLYGLRNGDVVFHISTREGLASDQCNALRIADDGNVWLATNRGLHHLVFEQEHLEQIQLLDKTHGLASYEVNDLRLHEGRVFAATNSGICFFEPGRPRIGSVLPPIYLRSIRINDLPWNKQDTLHLAHDQNNIQIEVVGVSFRDIGGIRYRYVMHGLSDEPVISPSGNISFQSLAPGNYLLEVVALNRMGDASETPVRLFFVIRPAFWQTWWFRSLLILAGISAVAGLAWLRFRFLRKKEREQAAFNRTLNELRLTALKAQMNPHFLFNSLGSIQNLINTDRKKEANIYLARFAKLLRMILDQSDQKEISLAETISQLELYLELESLRFEGAFTWDIQAPPPSRTRQIMIPPLIIQPFVENAIKHGLVPKGQGARLLIRFDVLQENTLYCCVEDNGIGREKRETLKAQSQTDHISRGISITQDRLRLINELRARKTTLNITDLYNENGLAAGTRVELMIPFGPDETLN